MPERRRILSFETDIGKSSTVKTIWELPDLTDVWYVPEYEHPLVEQARLRSQMGAKVKLWHDDIRVPPDDSWLWARNNADAMAVLGSGCRVDVLSMDHDLGGSHIPIHQLAALGDPDNTAMFGHETGVELADYIGRNDLYPSELIVHSMNSVGSGNILAALNRWAPQSDRYCIIRVQPFSR